MKRKVILMFLMMCFVSLLIPANVWAATEAESNDTLGTAQKVALDTTINGQISIAGDVDFYKFTLTESGRLTLDMTAYMKYNSLYLYDANGNQLWYDDYNEWNETVGFRNDVYAFDLIPGAYYLKVTGYRSSTNYASTGTYVLKNSFTSANATEVESNNSVAEAQTAALNEKVTGQIALND